MNLNTAFHTYNIDILTTVLAKNPPFQVDLMPLAVKTFKSEKNIPAEAYPFAIELVRKNFLEPNRFTAELLIDAHYVGEVDYYGYNPPTSREGKLARTLVDANLVDIPSLHGEIEKISNFGRSTLKRINVDLGLPPKTGLPDRYVILKRISSLFD